MMRRRGFYVLVVLVFTLSLAVVGCGNQGSQATATGNTTVGQVLVTQTNAGVTASGNFQWPSKMPTDVPQFTYGTITGSSNDIMTNIQATYENVTADAFDKYQSDLKKAGWTISNATQSAYGFEIDAAKAPRGVVAMFVSSKNNGLTGAVTYNDQSAK